MAIPVLGLALLLALTVPPLSSTRIQTWPWAAFAAAFWMLPILVALARLAARRSDAGLRGLLDPAFALIALFGLVATTLSPIRPTLAPHLLPFLGALSLPCALKPLLRSPRADTFAAAFIYPLLFATAFLWLSGLPSLAGPYGRNALPFGHANTTGSVCALSACWLVVLASRAGTRAARLLHLAGAILAILLAASSSSRGAVLALALACIVGAGLILLRRGRLLPFLVLAALALATAVLSNARLREIAVSGRWSAASNESNDQRLAMIRGGLALARERPFTGWGPGAVPYVFPRVRAALPGTPDNYLQLHNTPAQIAATLGLPGLLAAGLMLVALWLRLRAALRAPLRAPELAPIAATLACGFALLLFDHSFATPAFAVLAALPVAALVIVAPPAPSLITGHRPVIVAPAVVVLAVSIFVGRDLAARAAWSAALDAAALDEPVAYVANLRRAVALAPADPFYADQLASHLATGTPFPGLHGQDPAASISILRGWLDRNPALESTRYNLGWLLLPKEPVQAARQFEAAARLAPARAEVYLGLALSRIKSRDPRQPVSFLAAEILLDPSFGWSPRWRDAELAPYRAASLEHAADFLTARALRPEFVSLLRSPGDPVDALSAYRRVRTGHGVIFGHPDGPPPADVNILLQLDLPPALLAKLPPNGFIPASLLLECAGLLPR